ncbi:terminase small subunit [Rhizobium subbaraonis]|uniref:Terminase small subunit n=1 Tax=Rhizobium subbaraonis TaxID=908946 RepID=A0A285UVB3_9HYPH|nr:terminase small subunit [Rhizobium subbaraonis]SOC45750.1 terminase small subunit [Rhizobium subbaraonis]
MAVLKNARHERFAQAVAKGMSATEAYAEAGYKGDRTAASRLSTNVNVGQRVSELQAKTAKKVEITVDSLAAELEEARALAIKERQSSAAVSATMGKAKLFGLGVENRRLSGTLQIVTITAEQLGSLTRDELALLEAAYPVLEKLGVVGGDTGGQGEA